MVAAYGKLFLFEVFVEAVYLLAGGGIDDAGFIGMVFQIALDKFFLILAPAHFKVEVGAVKARDMNPWILQVQQMDDIVLDLRRSRGRKGADERAAGKTRDKGGNLPVARAEVMSPLGEAVRFVDGDHGDFLPLDDVAEVVGIEPLGGNVDEFIAAFGNGVKAEIAFLQG